MPKSIQKIPGTVLEHVLGRVLERVLGHALEHGGGGSLPITPHLCRHCLEDPTSRSLWEILFTTIDNLI